MNNLLSIVTPHKDDVEGLKAILKMLHNQTTSAWEWIIIDDFSCEENTTKIKEETELHHEKIKIFYNKENLKAAKSRNIGLKYATGKNVIFLDSDDEITSSFVENRLNSVNDFKVYLNFKTKDAKGNIHNFSDIKSDFFDNFLKSKFAWQTTVVLWNTRFLQKLGGFNEKLILLEDIELSIVALYSSKSFEVTLDNEIDFFYQLKPIDIKKRTFEKVSESVDIFINSISRKCNLTKRQRSYLSSYYFLSIRYFCRSEELNKINLVNGNLNTLYRSNCINLFQYIIGRFIIKLFTFKSITLNQFLSINRFFFKK